LPSRSAARDEALAVIEELSKPAEAGKSRRWASWFLEVTDDEGQFLRLPMGHPALEIVRAPVQWKGKGSPNWKAADMDTGRLQAKPVGAQLSDRSARAAELLERSRELYDSLRSLCDRTAALRIQSQSVVEHARRLLADEIPIPYLIVAALTRSRGRGIS
jgi:hypothetical protein